MAGVFVDMDHFIDYYANHGPSLKLIDIYDTLARVDIKKVYLLLHSYEIIILLWVIICATGASVFWKAAAIGLTQHMILDQFTNPIFLLGYFFTYRFLNRFDKEMIIKEEKLGSGRGQ